MLEENEIMVPVPGYGKRYHITNFGRVYSTWGDGKFLKLKKNSVGYWYVTFTTGLKFPKTKSVGIGRLLAICFVPNPNDYAEVGFIDGDKNNLRADNVEWISHSWNCRKKQAYVYTCWHKSDPDNVMTFYSRRQMQAETGLATDTIMSYLLNSPGKYGPNGWALSRSVTKGYGYDCIKPIEKK